MLQRIFYNFILLIVVINIAGCVESSFDLAQESRLPLWFKTSQGMKRDEFTVTMDYYMTSDSGKAVFNIFDKNGRRLKKVKGITQGRYPIQLKKPPLGFPIGYPKYEIVIVDGIVDVIEHRKMEPIFYMVDDSKVLEELGVKRKKRKGNKKRQKKGDKTFRDSPRRVR